MKKEKIEKIALSLILILGFGYAYTEFLLLPQWIVLQTSTSQLDIKKNDYQELLTYQGDQSGLQQKIITLETKVAELGTQVPDQLDKPQLMVGLYTLAKQHGVSPQSIAFEQAQTIGNYQELGMVFNSLGKPADTLAMIHDLQFGGSQRLVIKSINLTIQEGTMKAELKLAANASGGIPSASTQKPAFMNSPIGVASPTAMFQP